MHRERSIQGDDVVSTFDPTAVTRALTTRRLGRPAGGIHALQVELNRDLYMDEASFAIKDEAFRRLEALCLGLVEKLALVDLG